MRNAATAVHGVSALWRIAAVAVALLATALVVQRSGSRLDLKREPGYRVIEAPITGVSYAPLESRRSGPRPPVRRDETLRELASIVDRERTPTNLHRLGAATLALGDAREAAALLAEAARSSRDASVVADLAAAELAVGRIADAAQSAARALENDPEHAAAAFTWALAIEALANRPGAVAAWHRYLTLDSSSGWAREARRHLDDLGAPRPSYETDRHLLRGGMDRATIVRLTHQYPQRARARAHNVLLPAWLNDGRDADLVALRTIAEVRAEAGDPYLLDIVNHAATPQAALGKAMMVYSAARDAERAGRSDDAASQFAEAADRLRRAGSPLALGASVYAASSQVASGRADDAVAMLANIDRALAAVDHRYLAVVTEVEWVRGLLLARRGDSDAALDAYRKALAAARRSGEVEHEIAIAELIASRMAAVAEPEEADRLRVDVLRRLDDAGAEPLRMYVAYQEMAFTSLRAGRPHVALAFAAAATRIAEQSGDVAGQAMAASRRARALHDIGRSEAARVALADARVTATRIPSEGARDRALGEIDYTTGGMELRRNPRAARAAFASAVAIWERYGWRNHIAAGYLARGEAALLAGDPIAAEQDFMDGIRQMEYDRARISEPELRVAFFERSDTLFDGLTALLLDSGRVSEALSIVERKRARFLLDQTASHTASEPLDAVEILRRAQNGDAILEVSLLDRGAELWLVRNGTLVHGRSSASRRAIEDAATRHLESVRAGNEEGARKTGRWLHAQLIEPVAQQLPAEAGLVIVADGALQSFPFSTLVTPGGQYLIEARPVSIAPSASMYLRQAPFAEGGTLLAIAQPSPAGFTPLPEAQREATFIAQNHPRGRLLRGAAVTPEEFLELADTAGFVHYTGHATTDEDRPSRSSLVFEAPAGAAHLTAERIGRRRLHSRPFVVLAACSTGRGKSRRNEGAASIAAAFLQAGARGVAATLWDIDDAPSSRLFRTFHRHLAAGERPEESLRATQRAFIHSSNPSDRRASVWASITLIAAN